MLMVLVGFATGIISGMGIGGGTLLIPGLIFAVGAKQQIAQNINLMVFIPSSIAAIYVHIKKHNIEKNLLLKLSGTGCIGAAIGSIIAVNMESGRLKRYFGVFLLIMGIYEVISKNIKEERK